MRNLRHADTKQLGDEKDALSPRAVASPMKALPSTLPEPAPTTPPVPTTRVANAEVGVPPPQSSLDLTPTQQEPSDTLMPEGGVPMQSSVGSPSMQSVPPAQPEPLDSFMPEGGVPTPSSVGSPSPAQSEPSNTQDW